MMKIMLGHNHHEEHHHEHHHHDDDDCCGHDHGPGCACEANLENIDKEVDVEQSKKPLGILCSRNNPFSIWIWSRNI